MALETATVESHRSGLIQQVAELLGSPVLHRKENLAALVCSLPIDLPSSFHRDTAVEVEAARLLTSKCADTKSRGQRHTLAASMAKYYASEMSVRAANAAVQVHGGYGYVDEFIVGKLLRDARVTTLYEGTSQVQKLLIGRAVTGISAVT